MHAENFNQQKQKPMTDELTGIKKILQTGVHYHASDIYVSTGAQPILRVNGDIYPIEEHPVLDKATAERYLLEVMDQNLKDKFQKNSDLDFSITVEDIGRFRVNIFIQNKGISGIFRMIPETPLTLEELRLPETLKTFIFLSDNSKAALILINSLLSTAKIILSFLNLLFTTKNGIALAHPRIPT